MPETLSTLLPLLSLAFSVGFLTPQAEKSIQNVGEVATTKPEGTEGKKDIAPVIKWGMVGGVGALIVYFILNDFGETPTEGNNIFTNLPDPNNPGFDIYGNPLPPQEIKTVDLSDPLHNNVMTMFAEKGTPPPVEKGGEKFSTREEFENKLRELMSQNVNLKDLASLLGAEKFFYEERGGWGFRVRDFVDESFPRVSYQEGGVSSPIKLPESVSRIRDTILPPGEGEEIKTGSGTGFEPKKLFPRAQELARILTEIDARYEVIVGTNTPDMMRGESYQIFILGDKKIMVFVNNDEGNATFILRGVGADEWRTYSQLTKEELKKIPTVEVINYPGSMGEWRGKIYDALTRSGHTDVSSTETPLSETIKAGTAPEGWYTKKPLAQEVGMEDKSISKIAQELGAKNPEWFQEFRHSNGNTYTYYHPELVEKIKKARKELKI